MRKGMRRTKNEKKLKWNKEKFGCKVITARETKEEKKESEK